MKAEGWPKEGDMIGLLVEDVGVVANVIAGDDETEEVKFLSSDKGWYSAKYLGVRGLYGRGVLGRSLLKGD